MSTRLLCISVTSRQIRLELTEFVAVGLFSGVVSASVSGFVAVCTRHHLMELTEQIPAPHKINPRDFKAPHDLSSCAALIPSQFSFMEMKHIHQLSYVKHAHTHRRVWVC